MSLNVLITGGAGFVGSHTILELLNAGHSVICVDNGCNAFIEAGAKLPESLRRVQEITGKKIIFYSVDIRDQKELDGIFKENKIDCVIHLAALKSVGESSRFPMKYYDNNVFGTFELLEVMADNGVFNLVYISSATVYGEAQFLPVTEDHPTGNCTNPYAKSKYFVEEILKDLCKSDERWKVITLRFFNAVGAHNSGRLGKDPSGEPGNLLPYISLVADGKLGSLKVFGDDFDTHDGTGVRDYIHIMDLAEGHIAALNKLVHGDSKGYEVYNLGSGCGYSVLDMIKSFAKASSREIPYEIMPRRFGDVGACYGSTKKAERELGWKARKNLKDICEDTWRWQENISEGFVKK